MAKTLFQVGIKDTEGVSESLIRTLNTVRLAYFSDDLLGVSESLMRTLNTVRLAYFSDDLLLKWHCYIFPLTIGQNILYMVFTTEFRSDTLTD